MEGKAEARAHLEKKAPAERKQIHKGKIISLAVDKIDYGKGQEKTFDIVIHPGAVVIIPVDQDGNLVLVKQWRRAANQILLELPAGTLESGEDPLDCAKRELREEIGYEAKKIIPLGGFFTAPGFCTEYLYLYLAQDLRFNPLIGDDSDEIDTLALSLEESMKWIEQGKIIDAKTLVGIYRYEKWLRT